MHWTRRFSSGVGCQWIAKWLQAKECELNGLFHEVSAFPFQNPSCLAESSGPEPGGCITTKAHDSCDKNCSHREKLSTELPAVEALPREIFSSKLRLDRTYNLPYKPISPFCSEKNFRFFVCRTCRQRAAPRARRRERAPPCPRRLEVKGRAG